MDTVSAALLVIAAASLILVIGIYMAINAHKFSRELQYINMEIARTTGSERKYWKKQRRKLWLSLLLLRE